MLRRAALIALLFVTHGASAATAPSVTLHGKTFSTEFATDDASRELGLMNRTELAADHSMLFVFVDDEPRAFWMKNTLIPLDILYFNKDRQLVSMQLNAQPCKADPCAIYPSGGQYARYVLELKAGTAGKLGLKLGETLTIEGDPGTVR
ncbi:MULTISPECIES: DUF192 domain-containing protein [Luteibacter]|uniref:DUF192 domain-containing protein n=1 Tax=Luteibacter TaxID=242605 RepID=UPI000564C618|nr:MULTISPECIES: DUF192 domain-containing protein [unclassified Luteibacter]MDR6643596.1 uncharacterized membrane protein (UPF0127 family) [Luteibacter sp. 1214]